MQRLRTEIFDHVLERHTKVVSEVHPSLEEVIRARTCVGEFRLILLRQLIKDMLRNLLSGGIQHFFNPRLYMDHSNEIMRIR